MPDKIAFIFFLIGFGAIFFLIGAGAVYYRLPIIQPLTDAFKGGDAWHQVQQSLLQGDDTSRTKKKIDNDLILSAAVHWDKEKAYDGYTLLTVSYSNSVFLVDMQGKEIYRWQVPFQTAWPEPKHIHVFAKAHISIESAFVYPNGDLLVQYSGSGDTPYGYGIAKFNKDSELLWAYGQNTHHDMYVSPDDGRITAIVQAFVQKPAKEFKYLYYPQLADSIVVLSPEGQEISRFSVLEAFENTPYGLLFTHRIGKRWDSLHTNTVMRLDQAMAKEFPMFEAGDFLISLRNIGTIAVISAKTKKVIWAYRGPWNWQHAAHFVKGGRIILLDNFGQKTHRKRSSRIVEINPQSREIIWTYVGTKKQPFFTHSWGRLQRLPNGNTLAVEATESRIIEITPTGEVVWKYQLSRTVNKKKRPITTATRYHPAALTFLKEPAPD